MIGLASLLQLLLLLNGSTSVGAEVARIVQIATIHIPHHVTGPTKKLFLFYGKRMEGDLRVTHGTGKAFINNQQWLPPPSNTVEAKGSHAFTAADSAQYRKVPLIHALLAKGMAFPTAVDQYMNSRAKMERDMVNRYKEALASGTNAANEAALSAIDTAIADKRHSRPVLGGIEIQYRGDYSVLLIMTEIDSGPRTSEVDLDDVQARVKEWRSALAGNGPALIVCGTPSIVIGGAQARPAIDQVNSLLSGERAKDVSRRISGGLPKDMLSEIEREIRFANGGGR